MPKENRRSNKRGKRHDRKNSNTQSKAQEGLKSVVKNRYSPNLRKRSRRLKMERQSTIVKSHMSYPKCSSIIETGMKYITGSFHLLQFCIFGSSTASTDSKKPEKNERNSIKKSHHKEDKINEVNTNKETANTSNLPKDNSKKRNLILPAKLKLGSNATQTEQTKKKEEYVSNTKISRVTNINEVEDSIEELITAAEDSDFSTDHWCTARSTPINTSIDCNIFNEKEILNTAFDEPMDISIDDTNVEKNTSIVNFSQNKQTFKDLTNDVNQDNQTLISNIVDEEEIARIFQKQCTSRDNEFVSSSLNHNLGQKKKCFLLYRNGSFTNTSRTQQESDKFNKKQEFDEFTITRKKKEYINVNDIKDMKNEHRNEEQIYEEIFNTQQDTPSKRRLQSSRTPIIISKELKYKEAKYTNRCIETDSSFSDEDVEMISIEIDVSQQSCFRSCIRKLNTTPREVEEMDQDLDYVADNEDSNDSSEKYQPKRVPSISASSSEEFGFEHTTYKKSYHELLFKSTEGEVEQDDIVNTHQLPTSRAPPGFPKVPQNPPLMSNICSSSENLNVATMPWSRYYTPSNSNSICVPPAPTPMRHLYYDYPEFMDTPERINTSMILRNV